MDWESLYGNCARYEELLCEIERESLARQVWTRTHPPRRWWNTERIHQVRHWMARGASHQVRYAAHIGKLTITLSMLVNVQFDQPATEPALIATPTHYTSQPLPAAVETGPKRGERR